MADLNTKATGETLSTTARVLGFDAMEVLADINDEIRSVYLHVDDSLLHLFPDLVTGYRPRTLATSPLASTLCHQARLSPQEYIWRCVEDIENGETPEAGIISDVLHIQYNIDLKTEMAFKIPESNLRHDIYICGYSRKQIPFNPSSLKYLQGVGYAIGVALFDMGEVNPHSSNNNDLDIKEFLPKMCTPYSSANNLSTLGSNQELRSWMKHASGNSLSTLATSPTHHQSIVDKKCEDDFGYFVGEPLTQRGPEAVPDHENDETIPPHMEDLFNRQLLDEFIYPIINIPMKINCREDMRMSEIKSLHHLADGSNSNIYHGIYNGEMVIVKIMMDNAAMDPVARLEFDMEYAVLCRIDHPNIIRVLGSGKIPRKFIVLEYLGGGSLDTVLAQGQSSGGIGKKLFGRNTFDFCTMLTKARDIASALNYLHSQVHPLATIIHRDLKPDNIGFTKDGVLKVFDFGLCTCVKKRSDLSQTYEMSGNTGSLRYMAPEVALRQSYSEKADVYSFAIVIWQMARDKVAYRNMTKSEFMERVILGTERPKVDRNWPKSFISLLESCWHTDQNKRPSFDVISNQLDTLIHNHNRPSRTSTLRNLRIVSPLDVVPKISGRGAPIEGRQSSWF